MDEPIGRAGSDIAAGLTSQAGSDRPRELPQRAHQPQPRAREGDLINDAWRPVFECEPEEYSLKIFDRWGGLVWQSQNPEEYWTGGARADGRPLDEKLFFVRDGIYAFQVTYRDPTSLVRKIIRKTGHIKILR